MSDLFENLWDDYVTLNPSAKKIYDLLIAEGENVMNDHVAFRTFRSDRVGVDQFAKAFRSIGYEEKDDYQFEKKKLYAKHFEASDPNLPKVFISELKTEEFSPFVQNTVSRLISEIPEGFENKESLPYSGRPWEISHSDYLKLLEESEYAAWLSAFGFRANHFTVFVNELTKYNDLVSLNAFIETNGYELNAAGGKIKGSKDVLLEQSSTKAKGIAVDFTDGSFEIPACYYEFAKRYPEKGGDLYQGFVAASADKIFESTNTTG